MSSLRSEMVREAQQAANSAMSDFRRIQYQTLKLEADKFERDGYVGNALLTYARMIEAAQSVNPELYVPDILEEMLRLLKGGKVILHTSGMGDIMKALDTVPKEYSAVVEAIRDLIKTAMIR